MLFFQSPNLHNPQDSDTSEDSYFDIFACREVICQFALCRYLKVTTALVKLPPEFSFGICSCLSYISHKFHSFKALIRSTCVFELNHHFVSLLIYWFVMKFRDFQLYLHFQLSLGYYYYHF